MLGLMNLNDKSDKIAGKTYTSTPPLTWIKLILECSTGKNYPNKI